MSIELPDRSFVPLFAVLPVSFTGVPEESPPQAMATTVSETARIKILRIPEHTDDERSGIAARGRNPFARSVRRSDMWEASDEALLAGLAVGDRDAALVFVRRFQRRVYGCALAIVGDRGRAE